MGFLGSHYIYCHLAYSGCTYLANQLYKGATWYGNISEDIKSMDGFFSFYDRLPDRCKRQSAFFPKAELYRG